MIDGKYYRAEDTGSAVKGKIVDLYFESHDAANEYGLQKHEVFIVYE
jgi:3D (Asp-Asp-Asp) domain-containing protein